MKQVFQVLMWILDCSDIITLSPVCFPHNNLYLHSLHSKTTSLWFGDFRKPLRFEYPSFWRRNWPMYHIVNNILTSAFSSEGQGWAKHKLTSSQLQKFYDFSLSYTVTQDLTLFRFILLEVHSQLVYHINLAKLLDIKEFLLRVILVFCPIHFLFNFQNLSYLTHNFLINMLFMFHLCQFTLC